MASKPVKLEFAVEMTCQKCADAVKNALAAVPGIEETFIDLGNEQVIVSTTLTSCRVQDLIESTGLKAILRGMAHKNSGQSSSSAAVAIMTGDSGQQGIIRLVQSLGGPCLVDGTIDGLVPGMYAVFIHEYGDISQGCDSCGEIFEPQDNFDDLKYSEVGIINADISGRAEFRLENLKIKVWEVIGRSLVIHRQFGEGASDWKRVACGIIARSSGLFENTKRICACDGLTLWDERSLQQRHQSKTD